MAEKVTLFEANINLQQAIKDAQDLKVKLNELKEAQSKVKQTAGETSAEYIKLTADIKSTQVEYNSQINTITKVNTVNNTQIGTLERLNAQNATLRAEQKGLNLESKEGLKRNQEINKQINKNTETIKANSDQTVKNKINIGNYSSALGESGAVINVATTAAKTFGTALRIMLGPIGLVVAAIAALVSYFKRSEEGQNALIKVVSVFKVVLNNILDIIGKVGEALFSAVQKPKEAWQGFKDFIKGIGEFFQNTFGNVIGGSIEVFTGFLQKAFANIGLAWQKLKGVFADNTDGINKAQDKINEYNLKIEEGQKRVKEGAENLKISVVNAYNKAKDAISGFISEQQREIDIAKRLADQQAALDKFVRNSLVQESKDRLKLSQLKNEIDDKEKNNGEARIKLIDEENNLLDKVLERNLNIAKQKYEIKKAQNELSASTKEDLDEEAKLLADIYNVETQITSQRKEAIVKRIEAEREIIGEKQKQIGVIVDGLKLELDTYLLNNQLKTELEKGLTQSIIDEQVRRQNEINTKEQESLQLQLDNKLISQEEYNYLLLEQDTNLQNLRNELQFEFEEQERERKLEQAAIDFENDMILAEENMFVELDLQRKGLELKKKQEVDAAKKTGADVAKVDAKYRKAARALDQAEFNAKLSLAQGFSSNIAAIAGENTAIGKAAAVASTTIATIQSAVNSYNSLSGITVVGPVLGAIAAAAALVSGYAQVKQILAVKSGLPGEGKVSASVPSGGGNVPNVPSVTASTVAPSVGAGIVSRNATDTATESVTAGVSQALNESPLQPTLVTDDVTLNQNSQMSKNKTSSL